MLIASMIVKVDPRVANAVAEKLAGMADVTSYGVHKKEHIILVAEKKSAKELEQLSQYILMEFPDVIGVFPTYLTSMEAATE